MTIEERLKTHLGKSPFLDPTAYVAPGAVVVGDVRLGPKSSVWPTAVLRGDIHFIDVGEGSNIQDGAVVHLADDYPAVIGKYVTVGHRAIVHACTIEDECLIGMGAIILDGAVVGRRSIVGAGAVVTQKQVIPPGSLVLGMPAQVKRRLSDREQEELRGWAEKYVAVAEAHRAKNFSGK
jgi:carbonic anhydrase/acetyltransferase-like protein (isoleucine patch superfamily)